MKQSMLRYAFDLGCCLKELSYHTLTDDEAEFAKQIIAGLRKDSTSTTSIRKILTIVLDELERADRSVYGGCARSPLNIVADPSMGEVWALVKNPKR